MGGWVGGWVEEWDEKALQILYKNAHRGAEPRAAAARHGLSCPRKVVYRCCQRFVAKREPIVGMCVCLDVPFIIWTFQA